jgi:hypothetical protein
MVTLKQKMDPCYIAITAAYPSADAKELEQNLAYIKAISEDIKDRGMLQQAMIKFANTVGIERTSKIHAKLDTLGKFALNVDRLLHKQWNGDILQAGLSLMEESTSVIKGGGINSENLSSVKQKEYWGAFNREVDALGFGKEFRSGAFDDEIGNVIVTGKQHEGVHAEEINNTASLARKYYS